MINCMCDRRHGLGPQSEAGRRLRVHIYPYFESPSLGPLKPNVQGWLRWSGHHGVAELPLAAFTHLGSILNAAIDDKRILATRATPRACSGHEWITNQDRILVAPAGPCLAGGTAGPVRDRCHTRRWVWSAPGR